MGEIETGRLTDLLEGLEPRDIAWYQKEHLGSLRQMRFCEYYGGILDEKGTPRSEAIANSGLEVHYAYQILGGIRNPKRDKILCLCIGGGFSVQQTNRALERAAAGSLYPKRLRDAIIMLALNRGIHTVWQVNEQLEKNGQQLLA